jgi:acyl-CoA synthetase (AMP-forming)/AMP-acid ligase II
MTTVAARQLNFNDCSTSIQRSLKFDTPSFRGELTMAWFTPKPLILPEIIAQNARFLRNKPAWVCDGVTVTWSDFGEGTAKIGNALLDSGLEHGDRVIVLMKNSYEMAEAMFGIIRAGLVAVPLNVSITDDAIAGMIDNAGARAVIASGEHVLRVEGIHDSVVQQVGTRFICVDADVKGWQDYHELRESGSADSPKVTITAEDECNIIYSSGTTGLPKGIVHDHSCREAWASDMAVALRYHSGARTVCNLGLFSNISWVAMLSTMFCGGTIFIDRKFSPAGFLEMVERDRITHAAMVPLQFQMILECADFDRYDLSSLDAYMCCGSPLAVGLKRQIVARMPGAFIELYGLTEGLVTVLEPEDMLAKIESVGRPCPGQDVVILDSDDSVLPAGGAGEIVGHSRFMMAGYHNNDKENDANTWIHPSGVRWLRTGDIGKLDEDGFLYLVDRKKDLIISGGQNIYPADIEATLFENDAVHEAAVIGVASDKWGETPLAVIVRTEGAGVGEEELTAWANSRLGKQQRIAATVFVDELPRNPNGKVLKRELRKRFADTRF